MLEKSQSSLIASQFWESKRGRLKPTVLPTLRLKVSSPRPPARGDVTGEGRLYHDLDEWKQTCSHPSNKDSRDDASVINMAKTRGALVVVGSGPGIGSHVARTFSTHGFERIILLSRDPSRLDKDAEFIRAKAPSANISTLPIDLSKTSDIPSALAQVDKALGDTPLEAVLFNAARVGPSTLVEWPIEELETDIRIKVTGCYAVAQWAIPKLLAVKDTHKPAFLCTSGSIYKDPIPEVFSLAACKAAQHNLVHSMHKKYKEEGVYCGLVAVGGVVADENPQCNAEDIANKTWAASGAIRQWRLCLCVSL